MCECLCVCVCVYVCMVTCVCVCVCVTCGLCSELKPMPGVEGSEMEGEPSEEVMTE